MLKKNKSSSFDVSSLASKLTRKPKKSGRRKKALFATIAGASAAAAAGIAKASKGRDAR